MPALLYRTARLEADLDHLTDRRWRRRDHLTAATAAHVQRIADAASFRPGLVAHAWLRYLGNVGGRDVLRRLAITITGAGRDGRGLAFTDYTQVGDDVRPFFRAFHARLDALPLDLVGKTRVVTESRAGFRLNIALTDELARDHGLAADQGPSGAG